MEGQMDAALNLHDALLLRAPEGASHDVDTCSLCTDWSMGDDGVPAAYDRLDFADAKTPYGKVEYADPGYQKDGVKRYPIDTEAHARAAWSYIHQAGQAAKYTADQLAKVRVKIATALKRFGIKTDAVDKPNKNADANTDSNKPKSDSSASTADPQPEVASEGGTSHPMDTITQETHEALLDKALRDATASLEAEKAELTSKVTALTGTTESQTAEIAALKSENERLNGDLDTAQVELRAAQDETAALKADIASKEEAALKAEVAAERSSQVRNLALFPEDYITEKASRWADMDEAAWTERLDEWKAARGQAAPSPAPTTDTASAMTGSSEIPAGKAASARRLALGLID